MKYILVVVGQRPAKVENKYVPLDEANVAFIHDALSRVAPADYVAIWHGADTFGVDLEVERFATGNGIRQRQFPAYWSEWDADKKEFVTDNLAGAKRSRQMLRNAKDAVYDKATPDHRKPDHAVILLTFGDKDSTEIKYVTDFISNMKDSPFLHNHLDLPVNNSQSPVVNAADSPFVS